MRFWLAVKIIAGLTVAAVVTFTSMFTYHIAVKPLGGIFERIVPEPGTVLKVEKEEDFAKALESAEMPDYEPGNRAFIKANDLVAMGRLTEAREKLMGIVNVYPTSTIAPKARRIVGEMKLDEVLSSDFSEGKSTYKVKSGDSYYAIAARENTTLDMIMYLNRMMELPSLQPGDELMLMPLDYRILIEPHKKSLSLWDGTTFVCEYTILNMDGITLKNRKTTISTRRSTLDGRTVSSLAKNYRAASKSIQLKSPVLEIFPYDPDDETPPRGIFLRSTDIEELFLLTRSGNEVEIRTPKN
ncbi:MAG: LysM peptidoglycan-binding domain-containing protein [Luteolibacter sp.]